MFDRKVNSLYSRSAPQAEVKHDYFSAPIEDDPNDFATPDGSDVFGDSTAANGEIPSEADDDIMSDSELADFINNFNDEPPQPAKYEPRPRSRSVDIEDLPHASSRNTERVARPSFRPSPDHPREQQPPRQAQQPPQHAARPSAADGPQMSRTERARLAREERLKNL